MIDPPIIAAIIPAAGLSRRFETANKLLQPLSGPSVLQHVVRAALDSGCHTVTVVTGHDHERIADSLKDTPTVLVFNESFKLGMGSSIVTGVDSAGHADAYLIWPGDMPLVKPETAKQIIRAFDAAKIVVPVHEGEPGHPVLFSGRFRNDLLQLPAAQGARIVLDKNKDSVVRLDVDDAEIHCDIDTRKDLESIVRRISSSL